MTLGLIGMSGVGKTTLAERFAAAGYTCIHCDDLIAAQLRADGEFVHVALADVGRWMGFPGDDGFREREAKYLAHEAGVLRAIAAMLPPNDDPNLPIVIDMTGSAVFVAADILAALRQRMTVVYLAAATEQRSELFDAYLLNPRPVIWAGHYQRQPDETDRQALARSYHELLREREQRYHAFAHVILTPAVFQRPDLTPAGLQAEIAACRAANNRPEA